MLCNFILPTEVCISFVLAGMPPIGIEAQDFWVDKFSSWETSTFTLFWVNPDAGTAGLCKVDLAES